MKTKKETGFKSFEEYHRYHSPELILERLEERLCSALELTKPDQHKLRKNNQDQNTAVLILLDPGKRLSIDSVESIVASFYQSEGFEVRVHESHGLSLKKDDEVYSCSTYQKHDPECYEVYIFKDCCFDVIKKHSEKKT